MAETEDTTERWLPVVGYEGFYSVSDMGRVRSERGEPHILSPNRAGRYARVVLCVRMRRDDRSVHRLVAEAFLTPDPSRPHVNHIDGNRRNNRADNLEWATVRENFAHASRTGLMPSGARHGSRTHPESVPSGDRHGSHVHPERICRGERKPNTILTDDDVREIRTLVTDGARHRVVAAQFGVTEPTIWKIVHRRAWVHVA